MEINKLRGNGGHLIYEREFGETSYAISFGSSKRFRGYAERPIPSYNEHVTV